jgi:group I intron endonuclease
MYIYKITNLVNQKVYIGQTVQKNPKMRWYAHLADARRGKKSYLYDSIRKYSKESFVWEVIDCAASIDELNDKEEHWLNYYREQGITVYNNRNAGGNKTHSPESIERMKVAQKSRHATTTVGGWKRRDGGAMKGKSHPGKGKKWPAEKCINVRAAAAKRKNYREGKICVTIDGKKNWIEK